MDEAGVSDPHDSGESEGSADSGVIDRRKLIARAAVVAGAAWSAPVVLESLASPAAAVSDGGGGGGGPTTIPPPPPINLGEDGFSTTVAGVYEVNVQANRAVSYSLIGGGGGGGYTNTINGGSAATVTGTIPAQGSPYTLTIFVAQGGRPAHPTSSSDASRAGGEGGYGYRRQAQTWGQSGGNGGDGGTANSDSGVITGQAGGGGGGCSGILCLSTSVQITASGGGGSGGGAWTAPDRGAGGPSCDTGVISPPGTKWGFTGGTGLRKWGGKGGNGGTTVGGTGGDGGYWAYSTYFSTGGTNGTDNVAGNGGSPLDRNSESGDWNYSNRCGAGGGGGGGYYCGGGGGGATFTSAYGRVGSGGGGGGAGSSTVSGPVGITGSVGRADTSPDTFHTTPGTGPGHRGRGGYRVLPDGEHEGLYGQAGGDGSVTLAYVP